MRRYTKRSLFIFCLYLAMGCNAQVESKKKDNIKTETHMKQYIGITVNDLSQPFDYKTFDEKFDKNGLLSYVSYDLGDETNIKLTKSEDSPTEVRSKENHPVTQRIYYYSNGLVKKSIHMFNKSLFGKSKEFDRNGKLINETNYDKEFALSFDELRKIIFESKGIDIYDTKQAMAIRHEANNNARYKYPYYQIHVFKTLPNGILKPDYSFLLNSETGVEIK